MVWTEKGPHPRSEKRRGKGRRESCRSLGNTRSQRRDWAVRLESWRDTVIIRTMVLSKEGVARKI
jgi:hypothetical protein